MAKINNDEFKREAVRIALTSGQPRRQVAADLGVGFSTLAKWIQRSRPSDLPPAPVLSRHKTCNASRKSIIVILVGSAVYPAKGQSVVRN